MTSSALASPAEVLPGYSVDPVTGAWVSLPWPSDPDALDDLFAHSLGPGLIQWGESRLLNHLSGEPWKYTPAQGRFLILWYSVRWDGDRWKWRYRSGVERKAKGAGKDPFAAAMALGELCGPVMPAGKPGSLFGRAHRMSLVQVAANSEAQAGDVLRVANGMVGADMADEFGFDKGITRTQLASGSKIELLTFSEASSEGDPATAIFLNESHHMTHSSGGQRLAGVARRNVGKSPGGMARLLELTNAHMPGEGSVAEDSFTAWQAQVSGQTRRQDILYDSTEAPPHLNMAVEEELELGITAAYKDSPWIDRERIRDEAQDPRVPVADSVRFYFNALPTNELAWVDPRKFDSLAQPGEVVADQERVALFLDCSKSTDATVLVGCRIDDGHVFALGGWQRPHGDRGTGWLAPRHEVDVSVRAAFMRWRVMWFGVDPSPARDDDTEALYWAAVVEEWHKDFRDVLPVWATPGRTNGNSVLFDMRQSSHGGHERMRQFTAAAELVAHEIDEDGSLSWDGDPMLRQHVHNARRRPNQWGVGLGKRTRDSKDLVDYAVAMVGARLGRQIVRHVNPADPKKSGSGKVWGR